MKSEEVRGRSQAKFYMTRACGIHTDESPAGVTREFPSGFHSQDQTIYGWAFTNKLSSIYLHLLSFWLMQRSLSFSGLCSEIHTNRDFPIDWEPRNWAAFCAFCDILTRLCLFNIILGSSKYLQLTVVQDGWVDTLFIPWRKFTNSSSIHNHFRHKINTNKYCKHCKDYEN